jgi:uncharacterized protein YggU (UPF0235/DUF167 family)
VTPRRSDGRARSGRPSPRASGGRRPGLDLVATAAGTRLRLRVRAGATRQAILGSHGGALKVAVVAAAERGRANRAVLALVADALGLPPSALRLVAGETSPDKVVLVPLEPPEVERRLRGFCDTGQSDARAQR